MHAMACVKLENILLMARTRGVGRGEDTFLRESVYRECLGLAVVMEIDCYMGVRDSFGGQG